MATYTAAGTAIPQFSLIVTSDEALVDDPLTLSTVATPTSLTAVAYDANGFLATIGAAANVLTITDDLTWPLRTASRRRLTVAITPAIPAVGPPAVNTAATIVLTLASFTTPDLRVSTDNMANMSVAVTHTINLQLAPAGNPRR